MLVDICQNDVLFIVGIIILIIIITINSNTYNNSSKIDYKVSLIP